MRCGSCERAEKVESEGCRNRRILGNGLAGYIQKGKAFLSDRKLLALFRKQGTSKLNPALSHSPLKQKTVNNITVSNIPLFANAPIVEAIFDFQAATTLERTLIPC